MTNVVTGDGEPRDQESAIGIRCRLVKRAQAGDAQAAELADQLRTCLSVITPWTTKGTREGARYRLRG